MANECLSEYELNMRGVSDAFGQFIFPYDMGDKGMTDVVNELTSMLELRYKINSPKRPPRVIVVGPPGSGRTSQAKMLAEACGLVLISTKEMLKSVSERSPEKAKIIQDCIDKGEAIPDEIINPLVEKRI